MTFKIVQGDTSPALRSTLRDNSVPVPIDGYDEVKFHVENEYDEVIIDASSTGRVNVVDPSVGDVEYAWADGDTSDVGTYYGEWQVTYGDGSNETFPSEGKIEIEIVEEIA